MMGPECVWKLYFDCEKHNYWDYTKSRAGAPTHLDDLIDEAHMSHRVSLLQQDLLQMLHLEDMEGIRPVLGVCAVSCWGGCTCLQAAHIWSISFSR